MWCDWCPVETSIVGKSKFYVQNKFMLMCKYFNFIAHEDSQVVLVVYCQFEGEPV